MAAAVLRPDEGASKLCLCYRCRERKPRDQFRPPRYPGKESRDPLCRACRERPGAQPRGPNPSERRCRMCGIPLAAPGTIGLLCVPCDTVRKRRLDGTRTPEQRQAERQRRAERKGLPYTPGVKPWEAPRVRYGLARVRPDQFAEKRWRAIEDANARQAWRWWKAHAPAWWRAAAAACRREVERQDDRENWRRAKHRKRLRARDAIHRSLNVHGFEKLYEQTERCAYCLCRLTRKAAGSARPSDATIDHIIPISRGGAHASDNLAVVCYRCNSTKHADTPAEWFERTGSSSAARAVRLYRKHYGDERQSVLL